MAKYKAYPEYKDSGVEWLGEVPKDWNILSLKSITLIVNGSTPKSGVEEYWDGDINWITPTDLSQTSDVYINDSQRKITYQGLNSCGTSLVPQDTVILSTRAPIGSLAITTIQSCTNQGCKSLVVKNKIYSLFLYYYLSISTNSLNNLGRGSTFLELSTEDLGSFKVSIPDIGIEKIVTFLSYETAKIDNLIEKQQQLIELLKEKRQAVISHAVTKGLNPDVPMKDSGVEWLGDVPEHWTVAKLSFNYEVLLGKMLDDKKITGKYLGHYLRNTDVQWNTINTDELPTMDFKLEERERYSVKKGDLIVCEGGEIGRCAIWNKETPCFYQKALHRLRPLNNTNKTRFMFYALYDAAKQGRFISGAGKATIAHLPAEAFKQYKFTFPPFAEQKDITNFLDSNSELFDKLDKGIMDQLSILRERRTALISAAVTGKIDVRDWVAPDNNQTEQIQESAA